ncbi:MAG: hypothetical protein IANPNBLG_03473 [Bryobacteraceae bacterium]|nr:hypothetical protein [Bryobacteraceae bacterium]
MEPFLGSLMCVSFNFAPRGWAVCDGRLLAINQNQALFSLLGTTFGGNGQTTFALPDLRGRCAMGAGNGHAIGEHAGEEAHTINISEMPAHTHYWAATSTAGSQTTGAGNILAGAAIYSTGSASGSMNPGELTSAGGSQPHENRSPSLALTWIIALQGIFPSQN